MAERPLRQVLKLANEKRIMHGKAFQVVYFIGNECILVTTEINGLAPHLRSAGTASRGGGGGDGC